ncbi:MAG: TIGR04086 family membrane protein [Clostridia bacterium]|nr:TIGR04086 family membrane protein [Clostridia bacterium]
MSKVEIMNVKRKDLLSILSGTIVAIATTLILILLFALLIRFVNISENFIFPVNQVIKVISMIVGVLVFIKKQPQNGFLKGVLLGLTYYILSYIIFSILQGGFALSLNNFYDLILTTLMGGLIGIIIINILKR